MQKKSVWETNEAKDTGWATFWLDGHRIDIGLQDGRFSWDGSRSTYVEKRNDYNPASLADKLDEIAATIKSAAQMERAIIVAEAFSK